MPTLSGSHHKTSVAVAESSLGSDLAVTEMVGGGEAYSPLGLQWARLGPCGGIGSGSVLSLRSRTSSPEEAVLNTLQGNCYSYQTRLLR